MNRLSNDRKGSFNPAPCHWTQSSTFSNDLSLYYQPHLNIIITAPYPNQASSKRFPYQKYVFLIYISNPSHSLSFHQTVLTNHLPTYLPTYLLTWGIYLLQKLPVPHLIKEIPAICGIQTVTTIFAIVYLLSLRLRGLIQSTPFQPILLRSILIPSSHLCLGHPNGFFPSCLPTKTEHYSMNSGGSFTEPKLLAMKLANHLHLELGLRLRGAAPPPPTYLSGTDRNSSNLAKRQKCSDLDHATNYKPSLQLLTNKCTYTTFT